MTKKLFIKLSMLLFVLGMSTNVAWGGAIIGTPADWYYVNFTTRVSTPACGSNPNPGEVKLNYTDNQGEPDNPWITGAKPANPYEDKAECADGEATNAWEWGIRDAIWDIKNSNVKYTTKSSNVPQQYESTVYVNGYDAGWNWYNTYYKAEATEEEQIEMFEHFPFYAYFPDVIGYWNGGFESGALAAENGDALGIYNETRDVLDSIYKSPAEYRYVLNGPRNQYLTEGRAAGYNWYTSGHYLNNPAISKPVNPYNENEQSTLYCQWQSGWNEGLTDAQNGEERSTYPAWYYVDNDPTKGFVEGQKYNEGHDAGWDWYMALYGPTAWGASASLNGYAMIHMAGMDLEAMSAYAYFEAKVRENDGWYFTGWSYTEGESDLGGHVDTDTEEDKGYLFKIFPSDIQGFNNKSQAYAYATFKPVMVANYKVNGLINGTGNSTTIIFDVVGQRVSTEDFTVSIVHATDGDGDGNWSAVITSCADNKVTVTVTYNGSANGEFRGNVTLDSKSGCSQLTAPVFARVGGSGDVEATLYDGKVPATPAVTGTIEEVIEAAKNTNKIVVLNKNRATTLTVNANVTIDLNGYTLEQALTINGGNVTLAYSKYGGGGNAITVNGGNLILNGGEFTSLTITSGIVEQNGATFSDASSNSGTLTTTEGVFNGGLTSAGALTVNGGSFKGTNAITINGGTANINRGTIDGTSVGLKVTDGIVNVQKLAAIKGVTKSVSQEGGTVNIECGKFIGGLQGELNFVPVGRNGKQLRDTSCRYTDPIRLPDRICLSGRGNG